MSGGSRGATESGSLYTDFFDSSRLLIQTFLQNETRTVVTIAMMMTTKMTETVIVGIRSKA